MLFACVGKESTNDLVEEVCMDCCNVKYHFQDIEIESYSDLIDNKILVTVASETSESIKVNFEYLKKVKKYPFIGIFLVDRVTGEDQELVFKKSGRGNYTSKKAIDKNNIENIDIHIIYRNGEFCFSGVGYKLDMSKILE